MTRGIRLSLLATLLSLGAGTPAWSQSDPVIGQLMLTGANFCPRGWMPANGQILAIAQNQALFALYRDTYGGDGRSNFALPDLRGRVPMGAGQGPGLSSATPGQKTGSSMEGKGGGLVMTYCVAIQGTFPSRP